MLLVVAFLLLLLLPSPWNVVGAIAAGFGFLLEAVFWHRRLRGLRSGSGADALVGATGVAVDGLDPLGQVRIGGELWEARTASTVPPGALVRVTAVDGLLLDVELSENGASPKAP